MFKLNGTLKVANPTQVISDKFSKREFIITCENDKYPQDIQFQLTQDKCNLLDGVAVGSKLEVSWNLRGRSWTSPQGETKYFNTLEAWKIDVLGATAQPTKQVAKPANTEEEDDLPF
jgi:hypothetical protein